MFALYLLPSPFARSFFFSSLHFALFEAASVVLEQLQFAWARLGSSSRNLSQITVPFGEACTVPSWETIIQLDDNVLSWRLPLYLHNEQLWSHLKKKSKKSASILEQHSLCHCQSIDAPHSQRCLSLRLSHVCFTFLSILLFFSTWILSARAVYPSIAHGVAFLSLTVSQKTDSLVVQANGTQCCKQFLAHISMRHQYITFIAILLYHFLVFCILLFYTVWPCVNWWWINFSLVLCQDRTVDDNWRKLRVSFPVLLFYKHQIFCVDWSRSVKQVQIVQFSLLQCLHWSVEDDVQWKRAKEKFDLAEL